MSGVRFSLVALLLFAFARVASAQDLYFVDYRGEVEVLSSGGAVRLVAISGGELSLLANELALVPIRDAQTLRVKGVDVSAGFASGEPVNAVVWEPKQAEYRLYAARATRSRVVAVRAAQAATVKLSVLSSARDPMKSLRFREDTESWLFGRAKRPNPIDGPSQRYLELLSDVGASFGVRATRSFRAFALLGLERVYVNQQRLGAPFMSWISEVELEVDPAHPLVVSARSGEVLSVLVRPKLDGAVTIDFEQRQGLYARLSWTGWERSDEQGYAEVARLRRVVASGDFTVRSQAGKARVRVRRYRRTRSLEDLFDEFLRARAEPGERRKKDDLAPFVDGSFDRADPFRGVSLHRLPAASLLSLDHAHSPEEASKWAIPALLARNFGTGQLRLAALFHVLRVDADIDPSLCVPPEDAPINDLHAAVDLALQDLCGAAEHKPALGVRAFDALASHAPDDGFLLRVARELARRVERSYDLSLGQRSAAELAIRVPDDQRRDGSCRTLGRARVLEPGRHVVRIEGDRPRVLTLRALDAASSRVEIGPFSIGVQGSGELASRVRVPAGEQTIVVHDRRVLLELSEQGSLPCAELREVSQVWPTSAPLLVSLAETPVSSVGFEVLAPEGKPHVRGELDVAVGEQLVNVSILGRAARATFSVTTKPEMSEVVLDPHGQEVLARAYVTLGREGGALHPGGELPALSPGEWLERVRKASREIHAASPARPPLDALRQRSEALIALGHLRLAEHDYVRLARHRVYPPGIHGERLGPLNLAAKFPPLSREELGVFREALRADELGRGERAAEAFAKLPYPLAEARAAELRAEQSSAQNDAELALRAYVWAVHARQGPLDEEASGGLRRLESAVRFVSPLALDSSAGSYLESVDPRTEAESMRIAVGRAWLDAPPGTLVMREEEQLSAHIQAREPLALRYEAGCRGLLGEPCSVEVRSDGRRIGADSFVLTPGMHDIEFSPSVSGLGWVRLCPAKGECGDAYEWLTPELKRRWFAATASDPARLTVAGPTVVRLVLQSPAAGEITLKLGALERKIALPGPNTQETKLELPLFDQRAELEVRPDAGLAYVRVSVAEPLAATPRAPALPEAPPTPDLRDPPALVLTTPTGRELRRPGPFSVWAHERYVPAQVADLDSIAQGAPFIESAVRVLTSLPGQIYLYGGVLARLREGADSFGVLGKLDIGAPNRALPRLILSARGVSQNLPPWSWGLRSRASAYWMLGLARGFVLMPFTAFHYYHSPRYAERKDEVDPDVYSKFAVDNYRGGWLGLSGYYRPLLDVSLSATMYAMSNPDFATFDRIGQELNLHVMPGSGLSPWVTLSYASSYRYADAARPEPFLRQQLEAQAQSWLWIQGHQRVALGGVLGWILDVPAVVGMIQVSFLWSPGRGVMDLTPDEVEYRERMQEGALMADGLGARPSTIGVRGGD